MGNAIEDLRRATQLPEGDVVRILLEQHARIRQLFAAVAAASGREKQELFDDLRALLAVHETAEQMVLRPVSRLRTGEVEAEARIREEAAATIMLSELEKLPVESADFDRSLADFHNAVDRHAEAEEAQEFPVILREVAEETRQGLGERLTLAEMLAPTRERSGMVGSISRQVLAEPFDSVVSRVKEALAAR